MAEVDNCEKISRVNDFLVIILNKLYRGEALDNNDDKSIMASIDILKKAEIDISCIKCSSCFDFIFYLSILNDVLTGKINWDSVKEKMHYLKTAEAIDKVLCNLPNNISSNDFNVTNEFDENQGKKVVYFDHNIINEYVKQPEYLNFKKLISKSKLINYEYAYSPSHLEEVYKMKSDDEADIFIAAIRKISNNLVILRKDDNSLSLVYEDPIYSFNRIKKCGKKSTQALEEYRLIKSQDKKIWFPAFTEYEQLRRINNKDLFGTDSALLDKALAYSAYSVEKIKEVVSEGDLTKNYSLLNDIIYKLYNAFDILSFYSDKEEHTIRSGTHDIEHIIYAAKADAFVTNDTKVYKRAKMIFKGLGLTVKVYSLQEFIEQLEEECK